MAWLWIPPAQFSVLCSSYVPYISLHEMFVSLSTSDKLAVAVASEGSLNFLFGHWLLHFLQHLLWWFNLMYFRWDNGMIRMSMMVKYERSLLDPSAPVQCAHSTHQWQSTSMLFYHPIRKHWYSMPPRVVLLFYM